MTLPFLRDVELTSGLVVLEEFQVQQIKQAITEGLRPTLPADLPPAVSDFIQSCWAHVPEGTTLVPSYPKVFGKSGLH